MQKMFISQPYVYDHPTVNWLHFTFPWNINKNYINISKVVQLIV